MNWNLLGLIPLAFISEFLDSSLGMGYGITLTPILIILGFEPLEIIPAVLLSEFVSGLLAAFLHHKFNNVNFTYNSQDTKIALILSAFSVIGVIMAVIIAVNIPEYILKIIISLIVIIMGLIIIITINYKPKFSWKKITFLGIIASINKGLSGGSYGPLVMSGQMLSGIGVKNAVGITSFAEGITCLTGVIFYFILTNSIKWTISPFLVIGAVLSVPFSVLVVKKIPEKQYKVYVSIFILLIGIYVLIKTIFIL